MLNWLSQLEPLIHQYGLAGLFVDVFLESMGLPLPGEALIVVAAGLASLGQLNIYAVAATAYAAAVLGDNVGFLIGRRLGRPLVVRHGARIGITHDRLARVERLIQRRGPLIVMVARFVIVLRQLNGIAAGTAGMHWLSFLAANAIGAALWVGLWTTLAYQFGQNLIPTILHHLSWTALAAVVAVLAIIVGGWLAIRARRRKGVTRPPQRGAAIGNESDGDTSAEA